MRFRGEGSPFHTAADPLPLGGAADAGARAAPGPSFAPERERMSSPTLRQQAGYLRRLLRRREIEIVDPATGRPVPVLVELQSDVIRLLPMLESPKSEPPVVDLSLSDEALRWANLLARLRVLLPIAQAEELVSAVEAEAKAAPPSDATL